MSPQQEQIDGVQRSPRTGINIIIVGAGPGGLFMALEAWRKGIDVHVLDQSSQLLTGGDFFTITPNSLSTLEYYPKMLAEHKRNVNDAAIRWLTANSRLISQEEPEWKLSPDGHAAGSTPGSMANPRQQFQSMLMDQCIRLGVRFSWGKKVVKYEDHEASATAITTDGERFTADVVVAADGIASRSHDLINGGPLKRSPTGTTSSRVGFPRSAIAPNSKAAHLLQRKGERPQFNVYVGSTGDFLLFITDDFIGIVFSHKDVTGSGKESWTPSMSPQKLKEMYFSTGEWDDRILSLIDQIPKNLVDWVLTFREQKDVWTSTGGRVVQLGDAAHAFLPTSGNGATQAIEDAIVLAECIRAGGRDDLGISSKAYNLLRLRRVDIMQRVGPSSRAYMDAWDQKDLAAFRSPVTWGKWLWGLKPEMYARERYRDARRAVQEGKETAFEPRDIPPGYVHTPWTIASEFEKVKKDPAAMIKNNGYWGYV